jgi:CheY-like chemotaxis protein
MTKILIADDESNILMLLKVMLKEIEAEVITAENGEIAIQKAIEHKPDLIITDVVMPKKNGFEVCRTIRNTPDIENTPIIILSALGDEYNKITGFEEGADDYVIKPFNVEELKNKAKLLLVKHQSKTQNPHPTEPPKVQETAVKVDCVATGYNALDQNLFGGLPKGSNILLLGPLGIGKSSFARQFLMNGLLADEKCLWVAIDDDPKRIRSKLSENLPHTINDYEDSANIRFVDAYSWSSLSQPEDEAFAVNGVLELNQLSGVISDASFDLGHTVQEKSGGRRVIDSISSLLINFELSTVQRFINQIARTAMAFGGVTTLFLMEQGTVEEKVLNNVKYIMDGVIEFGEHEKERSVRVSHMKWTKANRDWVKLDS